MSVTYPSSIQRLIAYFTKMPGVGRRSAERLAMSMLKWSGPDLAGFAEVLANLKMTIRPCKVCGNLAEGDLCELCQDMTRQRDVICVVEQPSQILTIENSGCFRGMYHVLGGRLAPLSGKGPSDLRIGELHRRASEGGVRELIIATSPDVEGEATAHYLAREFGALGLTVSRIASGVPVGTDLNYADAATLSIAISARRRMEA